MRIAHGAAALLVVACTPSFAADLKSCATLDDDAARLVCYDELAGRKPAESAVAATAAAAPSTRFGAEQLLSTQTAKAQEPSTMHASIVGTFEGWEPKTRFKLDNGQTWVVVDERSAYFPAMQNPAVTIEKGVFGAYFLNLDGRNLRAKVKRVQ